LRKINMNVYTKLGFTVIFIVRRGNNVWHFGVQNGSIRAGNNK
jgi:hypothetical protein